MQRGKTKTCMESGRVAFVPIDRIRPNPAQPRKVFDRQGLEELAASIAQYGVIQPLSVRRQADGYELVAGERRLRASRLAGLTEVPCILLSVDEESSGMIALVENLQRRDLDYMEEAEGLARLMRLYGLSQEQAAAKVGKRGEAEGFLYVVSSLGVTGMRSEITTDLTSIVATIRENTRIPCAVGFGISTPQQAAAMAEYADGVIVGSAIVNIMEKYGKDAPQYVGDYVKEMKKALSVY